MSDTLYTTVGVPFTADATSVYAGDLPTGLVGTITAGIYAAPYPDNTVIVAPSTSSMVELSGPSYRATCTVNAPLLSGVVRFVIPAQGLLPQRIAEQALIVSPVVAPGSAGTITATDVLAGDGVRRDAYEPGSLIALRATVLDATGNPVDPATLTLKVQDPTGLITPNDLTGLTHTALGLYVLNILVAKPTRWGFEWDATGPTAAGDGTFYVRRPNVG